MPYTCPTCKRVLSGPNQYHSCFITDKETHLNKMNSEIEALYESLLSHLQSFSGIEIIYLKTCIQFNIGATYLSVYPKKDRLDLEFQLTREEDQFPIYICKRISKNRVLHRIAIAEIADFDQQLRNWLLEAYHTIKKR